MILCGNKLIDKIKGVIYSQHFLDKHKINSKFLRGEENWSLLL